MVTAIIIIITVIEAEAVSRIISNCCRSRGAPEEEVVSLHRTVSRSHHSDLVGPFWVIVAHLNAPSSPLPLVSINTILFCNNLPLIIFGRQLISLYLTVDLE